MYYTGKACAAPVPQVKGLGLFESGMDWSQWTWQEWLTAGVGVYALFSIANTTKRGAGAVRRKYRAAVRA